MPTTSCLLPGFSDLCRDYGDSQKHFCIRKHMENRTADLWCDVCLLCFPADHLSWWNHWKKYCTDHDNRSCWQQTETVAADVPNIDQSHHPDAGMDADPALFISAIHLRASRKVSLCTDLYRYLVSASAGWMDSYITETSFKGSVL